MNVLNSLKENNLILAEAMTIWHMLFINNYGK